jgi:hypothetical protein
MLVLHSRTSFGQTVCGPMDALKMPGVLQAEVQLFRTRYSSPFRVPTAEAYTNFFRCPQMKASRGVRSGERLGQDTGPCLPNNRVE